MEKINLVEILKDCPKGMELDCTNYDGIVKFDGFNKNNPYTIRISVMYDGVITIHSLTKYGQTSVSSYNKCVIFPKGKTTWEGFHKPFKDGDIVAFDNPHRESLEIFIFKDKKENNTLSTCYLMLDGDELVLEEGMYYVTRLATEEEKQKLFKAIKENGYSWNPETKTLEKLVEPKFEVGDIISPIRGVVDIAVLVLEVHLLYLPHAEVLVEVRAAH